MANATWVGPSAPTVRELLPCIGAICQEQHEELKHGVFEARTIPSLLLKVLRQAVPRTCQNYFSAFDRKGVYLTIDGSTDPTPVTGVTLIIDRYRSRPLGALGLWLREIDNFPSLLFGQDFSSADLYLQIGVQEEERTADEKSRIWCEDGLKDCTRPELRSEHPIVFTLRCLAGGLLQHPCCKRNEYWKDERTGF